MINIFDNFFEDEILFDTLHHSLKNLIKAGPVDENDFDYYRYKEFLEDEIYTLTGIKIWLDKVSYL